MVKKFTKKKPTGKKPFKPAKGKTAGSYVKMGNKGTGVNAYNVKSEPFPRVLMTKCRFGEQSTLSCTVADTTVANTYGLNTIYDPRRALGGRTTVGHAQLAVLYDQYWVMGAKISVRFYDVQGDGWLVGCRLRINGNDGASTESASDLVERPMTYLVGLSDTGNQQKTFKFYVKPWSLVGCSKLEYLANSSAYSSFISNNPSTVDNCVMDVFAVNPGSTGDVKYEIRIDYYTKLYGRKGLYSSII